ncbi:MAG: hypothetical protein ACSHX0_09380 [Akkermansiaceae bacterium]
MNIQDLSATGIIGILFAAFAIIAFVKGLVRIIFGIIALCIAIYLAWLSSEYTQSASFLGNYTQAIITGSIGIAVFLGSSRILRSVINPFNRSKLGTKFGFGLPAALISLLAGLFVIGFSFSAVHYAAALAELRRTQSGSTEDNDLKRDSFIISVQDKVDNSQLGRWFSQIDPFQSDTKLKLAKTLILYHDETRRLEMLKDPIFNTLFNHSLFVQLAYESQIKTSIEEGKVSKLYRSKLLQVALKDDLFQQSLKSVVFP